MSAIKTTVFGLNETQRKFNKLLKELKNKVPLYKRIEIKLLNEIDDTFNRESFEGKPWERLNTATVESRRTGRGPGGPKLLQDTGTLKRSFVGDVNNSRVKVGTNIEYAPKHEFGIGVPKRSFIPSKQRGLTIAIEVADDYIKDRLRQAGLK